jgi:glycosyltransferase involved in cell wall biosynthesis
MKSLSILICTIRERANLFKELYANLVKQSQGKPVEILFHYDNKEMRIGDKRNHLLLRADNDFVVFIDDDDWPVDNYVDLILEAINSDADVDCVGINVSMTTNSINVQRCCHSLKYKEWANGVDGWDYVRNITHFNPVRKDIALAVMFPSIRFGEDKVYSDSISLLCKKEFYIDAPLFHYRYDNSISHNEKYGIK